MVWELKGDGAGVVVGCAENGLVVWGPKTDGLAGAKAENADGVFALDALLAKALPLELLATPKGEVVVVNAETGGLVLLDALLANAFTLPPPKTGGFAFGALLAKALPPPRFENAEGAPPKRDGVVLDANALPPLGIGLETPKGEVVGAAPNADVPNAEVVGRAPKGEAVALPKADWIAVDRGAGPKEGCPKTEPPLGAALAPKTDGFPAKAEKPPPAVAGAGGELLAPAPNAEPLLANAAKPPVAGLIADAGAACPKAEVWPKAEVGFGWPKTEGFAAAAKPDCPKGDWPNADLPKAEVPVDAPPNVAEGFAAAAPKAEVEAGVEVPPLFFVACSNAWKTLETAFCMQSSLVIEHQNGWRNAPRRLAQPRPSWTIRKKAAIHVSGATETNTN